MDYTTSSIQQQQLIGKPSSHFNLYQDRNLCGNKTYSRCDQCYFYLRKLAPSNETRSLLSQNKHEIMRELFLLRLCRFIECRCSNDDEAEILAGNDIGHIWSSEKQ